MFQKYCECPVCHKTVLAYTTWIGWAHKDGDCWWTGDYEESDKPPKLNLWQRIKKHGLKARIF